MSVSLVPDIQKSIMSLPERAKFLVIKDQSDAAGAQALLSTIKQLRGKVADSYDPVIKAALASHRAALAAKKEHDEPLDGAEKIIKAKLAEWMSEQERIRKEAELQKAKELARAEADRLMALAAIAEDSGDEAAAQELFEEASAPITVSVPKPQVKVEGVTMRVSHVAEVVSLIDLIRWINDHPEYETLVVPNQAALNQLARSTKGSLKIGGVRVNETRSIATSPAR